MCVDVVRASAIRVAPIEHYESQAVPYSAGDAVVGVHTSRNEVQRTHVAVLTIVWRWKSR